MGSLSRCVYVIEQVYCCAYISYYMIGMNLTNLEVVDQERSVFGSTFRPAFG